MGVYVGTCVKNSGRHPAALWTDVDRCGGEVGQAEI